MLDRFMEKVSPEPNSGCWLWTSSLDSSGYGTFWKDRMANKAHRLAYEAFVGPISEGMQVCHKCDVRTCVNPDHLFLGTIQDNMNDRNKKLRHAHGERHARAKLTEDQVREIRSSSIGVVEAGNIYGVKSGVISKIRNRNIWRHVA